MIKIINKKAFFLMILVIGIFFVVLASLYYVKYHKKTYKVNNNDSSEISYDNNSLNNDSRNKNDILGQVEGDGNKKITDVKAGGAIIYTNRQYGYEIKFPKKWYIDDELSEKNIEEKEIDSGIKLGVGGQAFWSNYSNMNDYSPDNKPDDFHIIALTIYRDDNIDGDDSIEEFSKKIGFNDNSEKVDFQGNGITGIEFISPGLSIKNPRVAIIFKKDKLFYVFDLAFIEGDVKVAEEMESIIETFSLR